MADPQSVLPVQAAMAAALSSGKPERWRHEGFRGFAVPSEPSVDGCRMILVSISNPEAQAAPQKMCPAGDQ